MLKSEIKKAIINLNEIQEYLKYDDHIRDDDLVAADSHSEACKKIDKTLDILHRLI